MMSRSERLLLAGLALASLVVVLGLGALTTYGWRRWRDSARPRVLSTAPHGAVAASPKVVAAPAVRNLRWLIVGGGPTPEYNEASIEQDIIIATQVLGSKGHILFAGGADAVDVRTVDHSAGGDPLQNELGELFSPRGGRDSRYRRSTLPIAGAATRDEVEAALVAALADGNAPLLVYLAGHGDRADAPRDNAMGLWAGGSLRASDLAHLLDSSKTARSVQIIATTCFGGGLADAVFVDAQPSRGAPKTLRCGLFATTADLPAAGCDPDPDGTREQSYARHFWHALAGEDVNGAPIALSVLDIDGDGVISTLEAHTRARLLANDVDVPTTTSERWLRVKAKKHGRSEKVVLVEDDWLIRGLALDTGLGDDEAQVNAELASLEEQAAVAQTRLNERHAAEDQVFALLSAALLARWPILDDPWHPGFAALLSHEHDAIRSFLDGAAEHTAFREAVDTTNEAEQDFWELRRRIAPLARLARALETRTLAGRLKAAGGHDWATYQALLSCERRRP